MEDFLVKQNTRIMQYNEMWKLDSRENRKLELDFTYSLGLNTWTLDYTNKSYPNSLTPMLYLMIDP